MYRGVKYRGSNFDSRVNLVGKPRTNSAPEVAPTLVSLA